MVEVVDCDFFFSTHFKTVNEIQMFSVSNLIDRKLNIDSTLIDSRLYGNKNFTQHKIILFFPSVIITLTYHIRLVIFK